MPEGYTHLVPTDQRRWAERFLETPLHPPYHTTEETGKEAGRLPADRLGEDIMKDK